MTLAPTLHWSSNRFWRNGVPTRVVAGSMHYFRVHPEQWADRLQRLSDLGVTSVDTYVAWNFHQPSAAAEPDFSGWRDIEHFLSLAASAGLDAIVRPGPYICAEWNNGGYPVWFTAGVRGLRTARPDYLDEVARWFDVLLPRLLPLQATHGGPIIAFQAENEFGSYGDDPHAVAVIATLLRERGVTELISPTGPRRACSVRAPSMASSPPSPSGRGPTRRAGSRGPVDQRSPSSPPNTGADGSTIGGRSTTSDRRRVPPAH